MLALPPSCGMFPVPKFFFHVRDGTYSPDVVGTDLPDTYSAQAEAVKLCGALVKDLGAKFWDHGEWKLEVCDASNKQLFALTLTGVESGLPLA